MKFLQSKPAAPDLATWLTISVAGGLLLLSGLLVGAQGPNLLVGLKKVEGNSMGAPSDQSRSDCLVLAGRNVSFSLLLTHDSPSACFVWGVRANVSFAWSSPAQVNYSVSEGPVPNPVGPQVCLPLEYSVYSRNGTYGSSSLGVWERGCQGMFFAASSAGWTGGLNDPVEVLTTLSWS